MSSVVAHIRIMVTQAWVCLPNSHSRDSQYLSFFLLQIARFSAHFVAHTTSEVFLLLAQGSTESKMCVPLIFVTSLT